MLFVNTIPIRTLVAVAALVATGAFADVTIGGNLNQAYTTTTVNGSSPSKTTGLSAASNSNFVTFAGSEDLGSGLKASFKFEPGVSLNGGNTFGGSREGWIGVAGAFGDIKVGQQYTDIFFTVVGTDPNGFNNIVGWGPSSAMLNSANGNSLVANTDTISYVLPTLVEGVTVAINSFRPNVLPEGSWNTTSHAATTSATTFGSTGNSYRVSYANGGLYVGYSARSAAADKGTAYAASYDFGVAKIAYTSIDSTISGTRTTDSTYTISAPVTSAASVGLSSGSYNAGTKTTNAQFGGYYNLSKRTQLYGIYGKSSATASTTTTAFGVNHAF